jgi:UDP-glucuronate decarboxylase
MREFFLKSDIKEIVERLGDVVNILSGKTVLLTGGRGFVGRYFINVFAYLNETKLDEPVHVIVLDNLITAGKAGAEVSDLPNFCFVHHDVVVPFEYQENLDYVIHVAGIASPFYYRAHPLKTLDVAVTGTRNMLELATKSKARFTFFSSSEIYGDPDSRQVPTQESYRGNVACQGPRACYDEGKRLGETLCYIYHNTYGTATNIIRPFNVFGPGMQETDFRVLPNFASRLKTGLPLNVYGVGNQTRTFCYIVDAMVGFLSVILCGVVGETYNIGCSKPEISMLDLVKRIEKILDRTVPHNIIQHPDSYPADEPNRRCPDIRKARLQLGYDPQIELDEGLRRFLNWADRIYTGQ